MSKLPLLTAKEISKILKKLGFEFKRQKGCHMFFEHPDGRTTVIPNLAIQPKVLRIKEVR